jgi:hypothetical protein
MWAILAKLGALFAGPMGWLGRLALEWLWNKGAKAIKKAWDDWQRAKAQKAAADKLQEKTDAGASRDEKRDDEDTFINS